MKEKLFDYVVLSGDTSSGFLDFYPIVAEAWKRVWDVPVLLGILEVENTSSKKLQCVFGTQIKVKAVPDFSIQSQAKMLRYWIAAQQEEKVCLIQDLDYIPLSRWYLNERLIDKNGIQLFIGTSPRHYTQPGEEGKFPAGNMTAAGYVFKHFINYFDLPFSDWLKRFVANPKIYIEDSKANPYSSLFSDESWWRTYLKLNHFPEEFFCKREALLYPFSDRIIDRAKWEFDSIKLYDEYYYGAHLLRPYKLYEDQILPLLTYLREKFPGK